MGVSGVEVGVVDADDDADDDADFLDMAGACLPSLFIKNSFQFF